MAIESPTKIDFGQHSLLVTEKDFSYNDPRISYTNTQQAVELHVTVGILLVFPAPQYDENGKFIGPSAKLESISQEVFGQYMRIRELLGSCVANAESIVNKLKIPNAEIYKKSIDYKEGDNAYEIVKHFEFMKLKNNFVDYIKLNSAYSHLEAYGKKAGSPFRRELDDFVIYRNIFTHGMLRVMMPDYTYCIEYIGNVSKETEYMLITPKLIHSFNEVFVRFSKLIDDFRKTEIIQ